MYKQVLCLKFSIQYIQIQHAHNEFYLLDFNDIFINKLVTFLFAMMQHSARRSHSRGLDE